MNNKLIHRIFASLSFLVALATYLITVQPSVPFWDCGEFTSASTWQQVPHPPGAPLFLMVGRLFQIIIPFGDLGWRVNLVSVFASAFCVLFLYLITVMVIRNFRKENPATLGDMIAVYGSGLIAALSFTFSDTFWFNAVESEVYASSSLFVAVIVYLMMRWNEEADNPGHEKYLILIAYMIGLSIGVHLLSILTVFSIVMLVYFRKYKVSLNSFILMGIIALISYFVIYTVIVKWMPAILAGNLPLKNEAGEYSIEDSLFIKIIGIGIILFAIIGFLYSKMKNKQVLQLVSLSFILLMFGYSTYTQILLRSNANTPMNENEPKDFQKLTSYIGREQYGEQQSWPRRTDANDDLKVYYYTLKDEQGEYVYGEWYPPETERATRNDGTEVPVPKFKEVNMSGELNYMFKYQIWHMYFRYLLWNFAGRDSDIQDADYSFLGSSEEADLMNFNTGYGYLFPIRFWGLPLLIGLLGLYFHSRRDPKMALVYFIMFLLMGVLAAIAQNQQQPQPRERDYFYTGSFMVFSLWIGLGTYGLIEWIVKERQKTLIPALVVIAGLLLAPINMAANGWKMHSRAGDFIPFDYSYNILQSTEKDAILFTNGDNDTFPLWFLQDVEGVRRDVRVVNLSLGQTLWYIDQLKNREPWGAKKIPLTFPDESLVDENERGALSYEYGEARDIVIPVSKDIIGRFTDDPTLINDGRMRFTFTGRQLGEQNGKPVYFFGVNHKLVLDILQVTRFERPVYFANTVGPDVFSGLDRHLRLEGMARRVCPVPVAATKTGMVEPAIMEKCLMNIDNSNNFHKEPHFGFKFRNLNNSNVYYGEVHRRLMGSYRQLYSYFAGYMLDRYKDSTKAIKILDILDKNISVTQFPMNYDELVQIAMIYREAGAKAQADKYARMTIDLCNKYFADSDLRKAKGEHPLNEAKGAQGIYKSATKAYTILGDYTAAKKTLNELYNISKQNFNMMSGQLAQNDIQAIQRGLFEIFNLMANIDEMELSALESQGKKDQALARAKEIMKAYASSGDEMMKSLEGYMQDRINRMEGKVPALPADTAIR